MNCSSFSTRHALKCFFCLSWNVYDQTTTRRDVNNSLVYFWFSSSRNRLEIFKWVMILATLINYSRFVEFNEFFILFDILVVHYKFILMEKSIRWIIENENRQYYTTTRQVANACWSLKSKSKAENQYSELLLQNNFSHIVLPE